MDSRVLVLPGTGSVRTVLEAMLNGHAILAAYWKVAIVNQHSGFLICEFIGNNNRGFPSDSGGEANAESRVV